MSRKAQSIVSGIILILFAVCTIVTGVIISQNHDTKLKNCTEQITAEVIENIESTEEERTSDYEYKNTKIRYKNIEVYKSIFEYEYKGNTYRTESKKSKYSPLFRVGEKVELKINPSKPYEFCFKDESLFYNSMKIFFALGGFFLIFGIYMFIKARR